MTFLPGAVYPARSVDFSISFHKPNKPEKPGKPYPGHARQNELWSLLAFWSCRDGKVIDEELVVPPPTGRVIQGLSGVVRDGG